jgi:hypothetical protein
LGAGGGWPEKIKKANKFSMSAQGEHANNYQERGIRLLSQGVQLSGCGFRANRITRKGMKRTS